MQRCLLDNTRAPPRILCVILCRGRSNSRPVYNGGSVRVENSHGVVEYCLNLVGKTGAHDQSRSVIFSSMRDKFDASDMIELIMCGAQAQWGVQTVLGPLLTHRT